ncbi:MAG: hypothetical protein HY901_00390 [Deltaproteobacteria bacterium]|nr:hypothetical protein [Deltaproteobacteria bacterium]
MRGVLVWSCWMGCLALAGCSKAPEAASELVLRVRGPDGTAPARFEIIADVAQSTVTSVECGGAESPPLGWSCGQGEARFAQAPEELGLTVRSPGLRTLRTRVRPTYPSTGHGEAELALAALPAAVANADYRTGFPLDSTVADLQALAWSTSDELGPVHVVKFYLEKLDAEPEVYFQNTAKHPIHYDFVRRVLGRSINSADFVRATYQGADRKAMAGSILFRPDAKTRGVAGPLTVEFFPSDDLNPAQAATAVTLLAERMPFAPWHGVAHVAFYLPAGTTHETQAEGSARELEAAGVPWLKRLDLYQGLTQQILNPGVAFGTLRVVTPEQLATEAVSFRDVLVLTRLPNELPIVGGSITEELQTPLAHVNVAARARGTPNMSLLGASQDSRVAPLVGKLVRFEVRPGQFSLAEASLADAEAFWQERANRPELVPEADLTTAGLPDFSSLGFADSKSVGAKAANLAELSKLLPGIAPNGFALPFAHYDQFLQTAVPAAAAFDAARADCVSEKRAAALCDQAVALLRPPAAAETLAQLIARLLATPTFQTDSNLRFATLDALRLLFCAVPVDAALAADLDAKVASLGGVPVRLRSSTNAEDLPNFSGAGLYTSVSAEAAGTKIASRRLCKVWGSVWNWTAFEERAFWNINHQAVRMAVAVHPSYPNEAANGVLITQNIAEPTVAGMYVNVQKGEVSVTNPTDGAIPEVFSILPAPAGLQVARQRFSSLSPTAPLLSDTEISALYAAANKAQRHFAPLYQKSPEELALDIEFKFDGPERRLVLKQARPYFEH